MPAPEAQAIIEELGMIRHPEGGWYAETWRDEAGPDGRARGTAIYFLLEGNDVSHWHRVDAAEMWLWHAGAPLTLWISTDGETISEIALGSNLTAGQRPQGLVPTGAWQSARSTGAWTLVSCTVTPGFEFSGFELAQPGWVPGRPA